MHGLMFVHLLEMHNLPRQRSVVDTYNELVVFTASSTERHNHDP